MNKFRLAWLATHPIQYQAPLLRALSNVAEIELTALFFSDFSTKAYVDQEFGSQVKWDTPLLQGYNYKFLSSLGNSNKETTFTSPIIKGLSTELTLEHYDAVIVQGWNHYGYIEAAIKANKAGLKVFLRCEATDHVSSSQGIKKYLREKIVSKVINCTDRVLAIGTNNKDFYLSRGVPSDRIRISPYCVDNEYFQSHIHENKIAALKESLNIKNGVPVILYASKLTRRKYADLLLSAYSQIPGEKPYLVIVGDGELRPELEKMVRSLELENVRILGFQNQSALPSYYGLADIFVLPSINETWGLVVNEAMNAKCAIIVTDQVGASTDLVMNGENGFIIPAQNEYALTKAMIDTINNRRYVDMGKNSLNRINSWGIPQNVDVIVSVLNEELGS